MKRIINIILIIILSLFILLVYMKKGHAFDLSASIRQDIYTNENIDPGNSLIIKATSDIGVYLVAGAAETQMRMGGQHFMAIEDDQLGIGFKKDLLKGFSIYCQVAYHYMGNSKMDGSYPEAVNYYWRNKLPGETKPDWSSMGGDGNDIEYTKIQNYIGGEIGANFSHRFKIVEVGIGAAYRIGETNMLTVYRNDVVVKERGIWWRSEDGVDMGGPTVQATVIVYF